MRDDRPTGTVTFLFTDVEGSRRLLHELGADAYAEAFAEHRRLIREACACHDGVEADTQGDAFLLAFPTAPGALAAAGEMTQALASSGETGLFHRYDDWRRMMRNRSIHAALRAIHAVFS